MINNVALDIGIGLALMFLMLSLMGTVINEFISTIFSIRAKTLKTAVKNLLDDPVLHANFVKHGLIAGTTKTAGDPSYLTGQTFAMALLGSLDPSKPLPGLAEVNAAINKLDEGSTFRTTLQALVANAGQDATKLRDEIASYFDASMDRVTGIYKRYLKWISLGVGLLIVVALNADAIGVGAALWKDSSLRSQMLATSQSVVKAGIPDTAFKDLNPSLLGSKLGELENNIRPLPIGWPDDSYSKQTFKSWTDIFCSRWFWAKLFGLIITAFAISLGAPFWFDLLSKLMNVRGAGPKPDSTTATAAPTTATPPAGVRQKPA